MAEKPQLESGELPPHPFAVEGRVPAGEVRGLESREVGQGVEERERAVSTIFGRDPFEKGLRIMGAEVFEHRPSVVY